MSKEKSKLTAESAHEWAAKHAAEGLDLKALNAALAAVEKKTAEAHAAAARLGEILEARKEALKAVKKAWKDAKDARKNPKPVKPAAKASPAKKAPAKKSSSS